MPSLTEIQVKNAKPREKRYKLADADGLILEVMTSGAKFWRVRYWLHKKEHLLSVGEYPMVSLREARIRRDEIRKMIYDGQDPSIYKKSQRAIDCRPTFGFVFEEWMEKRIIPVCTPKYAEQTRSRVKRHILPFLRDSVASDITSLVLLNVLRRIEAKGTTDIAHRMKQICGQIFQYGIAAGMCENDPSAPLKGALLAHKPKHQASIIDPRQVGALMTAIEAYPSTIVRCAMQLQALTFVRPVELRKAEWTEINASQAEWIIPAEKMKMRRPHIIPLSAQSLIILEKLRELSGHGRYIFPSARTPAGNRPMSENAVLAALRSMGFEKGVMTGHGFRSTASTLLNANGWNRDVIERQLAHMESNSVRASYNFAEYLPERRKMMQWWADYLDALKGRDADNG
jgi:integrase